MGQFIQQLNQSASNSIQLICFPFAGGYSATFRPLYPILQNSCDFYVVEPPGHGSNQMPLEENFENLVDMYLYDMIPMLNKPFILLGHSMGGLIVYRLAQRLEQYNIFPESLIISAVQPPNIKRKIVSHMDDDDFLNYVIDIGGIPTELIQEREFLQHFLPQLKADFRALESFEHTNHKKVMSSVHIFNGNEDEPCMAAATGWERWANVSGYHIFNGGHMFLQSEPEKFAEAIRSVFSLITRKKESV